jgi:putative acetyltransferase
MIEKLEIREIEPGDLPAIESLYPKAFPDEDLLPVVRQLIGDTSIVMSLVATIDSQVTGHVIFTKCRVDGGDEKVSLLAPLAVLPEFQSQGIGSAIVRDGLQRLTQAGISQVFVLGDPAYYSRFGFAPESSVEPPFPMPDEWTEAWQSLNLAGAPLPGPGKLSVPSPWCHPDLWAP